MPRMNILNTVEREAFNSPPVFNSFQRKQYFDFPSKVKSLPRSSSGASPRKCARFWKAYLRRNGSWAIPSPAKPAPTSSP